MRLESSNPVEDPRVAELQREIGRLRARVDQVVVDTIGFNDKTELPGGYRHTDALHVVERFRRVTFDHLDYQATIEDPSIFEKPWMVHRTLPLRTDLERVDEFVCENNRDYSGLFQK